MQRRVAAAISVVDGCLRIRTDMRRRACVRAVRFGAVRCGLSVCRAGSLPQEMRAIVGASTKAHMRGQAFKNQKSSRVCVQIEHVGMPTLQ